MTAVDQRDHFAREWHVAVDAWQETATAFLGFGRRDDGRVVLKVIKSLGDEWRSGEVLRAFGGRGVAHVLEHQPGAILLERIEPGTSLVDLVREGRDAKATEIIAEVIASMSPSHDVAECPTVYDWARGFVRYRDSGDTRVPRDLVTHAEQLYLELCDSQRETRLLHGDLQHYNILYDERRGWLAIDPKGVIGEIEYETGAMMRNPVDVPDLHARHDVIRRRARQLATALHLDEQRMLRWAFAQAVLSAIWSVEDNGAVDESDPALLLARAIRPLVS